MCPGDERKSGLPEEKIDLPTIETKTTTATTLSETTVLPIISTVVIEETLTTIEAEEEEKEENTTDNEKSLYFLSIFKYFFKISKFQMISIHQSL